MITLNLENKYLQIHKINPGAVKFGYSEKATKFEKIFHLKFDDTQ